MGIPWNGRHLCNMSLRLAMTCLAVVMGGVLPAQLPCALVGSASDNGGGCYTLTNNVIQQSGAVWFNDQVDLSVPVSIWAQVNLGSQDATGADGIAFMLQDVGQWAVGGINEDLGIVPNGLGASLGVEIDTWNNANLGDIAEDHMSLFRDGINNHSIPFYNLAGPVPAKTNGANIEDGQPHEFKFEWDPVSQTVEVYFDCVLRLSWTGDLIGNVFNGQTQVWWGITGSTGGSSNLQQICVPYLEPEHDLCEGEAVSLALEGTSAASASWVPTNGLSDPNGVVTDAAPLLNTSYTVTWVDGCGEPWTEETTVSVVPIPTPVLPAVSEFCPGDAVTYTVGVPMGGTAIWSDGTNGANWTGSTPGAVTVDVTGPEGCVGSASSTLVELAPVAVTLPAVGPLCAGVTSAIVWPAGTANWLVDNQPTSSPWTVASGNYALAYEDVATGCVLTASYTVQATVPDVPALPSGYSACQGLGAQLLLSAGAGATFTWTPSTGLDDPTLEQPTATPSVTTTYTAEVTDICGGVTSLVTSVAIFDIPDPGLPDSVSLCPGEMATLSVSPLVGVPAPVWSDGTTGWDWMGNAAGWQSVIVAPLPACTGEDSTYVLPQSPQAPVFEVAPLCPGDFMFIPWPAGWSGWEVDGVPAEPAGWTVTDSGVYFFVATEDASGCDVAGSIPVPNGALPELGLPDRIELCDGAAAVLEVFAPDPVNWNDGETGSIRVVREPGLYIASHVAECGSVTDSTLVVNVACGCAVYAPSAFSPDGDLINDAWRPTFECAPDEYSLQIYDKWGGLVWQSADPEEFWTGGYREDGRPLDEKLYFVRDGIYAFQLTYRDPTSLVRKVIRKTGSILILR